MSRFEAYVDAGFLRVAAASLESAERGRRIGSSRVRVNGHGMSRALRALPRWVPELERHAPRAPRVYDAVVPRAYDAARHEADVEYVDELREAGLNVNLGELKPSNFELTAPFERALRRAAGEIGTDAEALVGALEQELVRSPLRTLRQKGVDTKLATHLVMRAANDQYDTAVLLTGDSDFLAPVQHVLTQHRKSVIVLAPPGTTGPNPGATRIARPLLRAATAVFEVPPGLMKKLYRLRP